MKNDTCLLVCTTLILLCTMNCVQGTEEVIVEVAEKASFSFVMKTVSRQASDICSVKAPTREKPYRLDPLLPRDSPDVRIRFSNSSMTECGVTVPNADARSDTGRWRIYVTNTTGSYNEDFIVRVVVPTRNVIPKMPVSVVDGQDLYLRFEDLTVSQLVECRVNWTNGDVVLKPESNVNLLVNYWGTGLTNDCGVKAKQISVSDSGTWKLRAQNSTGHVVEGTFEVAVVTESFPSETEKIFINGGYETMNLGANNSKYCQAQNPSGQWEELKLHSCSVKLGKVTKAHEGKWTARFAIAGQIDELQTTVLVRVKESDTLHTSLTPSTRHSGALDLLCRWTTLEYASIQAEYCRFIRPDGVAMSLQDGIGNANYSYNGDGLNFSYSVKDCGVTIHKPQKSDVGTWQCLIGVDFQNLIKGGFIHVPSTTMTDVNTSVQNNRDIKATGGESDIVIQDQDPLTLSCHATASLNYCWFGHPNGTILTAHGKALSTKSMTRSVRSGYSYTGQGLALGDCTITVTTASHSDAGKWSCNMGVKGSVDLKVSLVVRVAEGNIVAHAPTINYTTSDSAFLKCHSVPSGVALEYCRFMRPDGVGFGFTTNDEVVMLRYRYYGEGLERGECGLKIDTVHDIDFGQWTCAALHVAHNVEGRAIITLTDQRELSGGAVAGIVIGSVVVVVLLGAPMWYTYRRYRTRM